MFRKGAKRRFSFELSAGCQIVSGEIALNWVVSRNTEVIVGEKLIDENGNDASTWIPMPVSVTYTEEKTTTNSGFSIK